MGKYCIPKRMSNSDRKKAAAEKHNAEYEAEKTAPQKRARRRNANKALAHAMILGCGYGFK